MKRTPPSTPGRTWRPGLAPTAEPRRGREPEWRKSPEQRTRRRRRWSPPLKAACAVLAFLINTGLLIWVSFWLRFAKPACLVLIGASYDDNLAVPHNVYGWESLQGLAGLGRPDRSAGARGDALLRLKHEPFVLRAGSTWDQDLDHFAEETVVLFLALHGGADLRGAYLLPHDAGIEDDERNRLRLDEIVTRLARLPARKNKVLLLDATQLTAHWPLGLLHNDLARALERLEPRLAEVPNLVVLSASAPDQRSWVSEDWRQSVFAHYVIEGLKGAAETDGNGRVSLWELHGYVRGHVERWVWANREEAQTPVLLPRGAEGERRARAICLSLVHRAYRPPDPRDLPERGVPAGLLEAWEKCARLGRQVPAPAVYAPHTWQHYLSVLLRYDQLLQAGAQETATTLAGRLHELEHGIEQARCLELSSAQNTLPMPVAAGLTDLDADPLAPQLNALWDASAEDHGRLWAQLQKSQGDTSPWGRRLLWLKLCDLLVARAAEDPANNLAKAANLLQVLNDPLSVCPAEVHFLVMLNRHLPVAGLSREHAELFRLALRLRRQAERTALAVQAGAYAYSELVFPWIQAQVEEADGQRRLGEDLLFATTSPDWKKARNYLQQAATSYQAAQESAAVVRQALAVRDQVLAALPAYSHWLARRRLADGAQWQKEDAALLSHVEELWRDAHRLRQLLEQPQADRLHRPSADQAQVARSPSLAEQAERVGRRFRDLERGFVEYWQALDDVDLPSVLRDSEEALAIPWLDPHLRLRLLRNKQRVSRRLLIETAALDQEAPGRPSEASRDRVQEGARRQGRMALAVLGERLFDQLGGAGAETYVQVQHRLETFGVEANWWDSLAQAGEQVGRRWGSLPGEINRLTNQSRATDVGQARPALQAAARLARLLDGAGSLELSSNPVDAYRRLCVQDLLLWQARRTLDDHWFALDPNAEPYYRVAGLEYLEDARDVVPWKAERPALDDLERQLRQPGQLALSGPTRRAVTSELHFGLAYRLQPARDAAVPPGFPVVWLEPGPLLQLVEPAGPDRRVWPLGADPAAPPLTCTLTSPFLKQAEAHPPRRPRVEQTAVTARGFYRGQAIALETRIDLHPLAETVFYQHPLPATAGVAVRASRPVLEQFGASNGGVAIVLDCSGSMGPAAGQPFTDATKFAEATRALKQVLGKIPKGTTVSLWVFGQAMRPRKTVKDAEQTVRRVQDPVPWDPDDPAQLQQLMAKVEYPALEPWNESPVVRAILAAKEDLRQVAGFKTTLVLTDGMDNRFDHDRALNPARKDIPTVLREAFHDSGIVLHVVGFKVESREEAKAQEQFKVVEDLPLPGKFSTVTESRELAGVLERALRQRLHYWVDRADNVAAAGLPAAGLEVSPAGANDQWPAGGLAPGGYQVRVHAHHPLRKSLILDRGDLLLVRLVAGGRGLEFERGLYSRDDYPWKPWRGQAGWRLAVLQNQQLGDRALQMLLTLEKDYDPRENALQQLKPRQTWIEAEPASGHTVPYSLRWGYRAGYPAPAWSLDVPEWPALLGGRTLAPPVVRAWWNPDQQTPPAGTLDRGADFQALPDLAGRVVQVEGDAIVVEGVAIEDHPVETRPGVVAVQSCLVVRLSHARNRPVWVRPLGLDPAGQEHRFYAACDRYTGLFWPVSREGAAALAGLSLYSLAAFKSEAERRGFVLELGNLKAPAADEVWPRPPVELK